MRSLGTPGAILLALMLSVATAGPSFASGRQRRGTKLKERRRPRRCEPHAVFPFGSLVDPEAQDRHLLVCQTLAFRRHDDLGIVAGDDGHHAARLARSGHDDGARIPSLEKKLSRLQGEPSLLLTACVAGSAAALEDGPHVLSKVERGMSLLGRRRGPSCGQKKNSAQGRRAAQGAPEIDLGTHGGIIGVLRRTARGRESAFGEVAGSEPNPGG